MAIVQIPETFYPDLIQLVNAGDGEKLDRVLNAGVEDSTTNLIIVGQSRNKLLAIRVGDTTIESKIANPDEVDPDNESGVDESEQPIAASFQEPVFDEIHFRERGRRIRGMAKRQNDRSTDKRDDCKDGKPCGLACIPVDRDCTVGTAAKESTKEALTADNAVNTAGTIGSLVGRQIAGDTGALVGDLGGALAARALLSVRRAAITAKAKTSRERALANASRVERFRRLSQATLQEMRSPEFKARLADDLTGDISGWAVGNAAANAIGSLDGTLARVPLKGAAVAAVAVPRIQEARRRLAAALRDRGFSEYLLDDIALAFAGFDRSEDGTIAFAAKTAARKSTGRNTKRNSKRSDAPDGQPRERKKKNCKPTSLACGFTCMSPVTKSGKPRVCRQGNQDLEKQKELKDQISQETKAIEPAKSVPVTNKPVSEAFTEVGGEDADDFSRQELRTALAAIDRVHKDGELPPIPIEVDPELQSEGAFGWNDDPTDPNGLIARRILIRRDSESQAFTAIHEIGHFLDSQVMHGNEGRQGRYASLNDSDFEEWRGAVMQSQAFQRLTQLNDDGEPYRDYVQYLLRPHEIFARSYAQWIAVRSKDRTLLEQLFDQQVISFGYPSQWQDDDFEPIAQSLDNLFKKKGWMSLTPA